MKPIPIRFKDQTMDKIKQATEFGHHNISNSDAARAAINIGLEMLEGAKESMTYDEYMIFILNNQ